MKYLPCRLAIFSLLSLCQLHASPLPLDEAIEIVKAQNLEIKASTLSTQSAQRDIKAAQGAQYGSLNFTQTATRSNDAGNVFGFKLSSREAKFADFGLSDYTGDPSIQPKDLNYPGYNNYYQSKLTYSVPLYTGGQLSGYEKIASEMEKIKQLDTLSVTGEKIYQTRKSYYDMALIQHSIDQMNLILKNITTLEKTTGAMIDEGYAKKVDLLEVQSKKINTQRLIAEMQSNQKLLYHYLSFLLNQNVTEILVPNDDNVYVNLEEEDLMNSNLTLQKASRGVEIRSSMIDVANASFCPQIGAFAEASSADNTFLGNFNDHKAFTIGARLNWNLFNGGIDGQNLEKARIEQLKSKTEEELAKKGIALQYDQIRTEIQNDELQIASLTRELELSQKIYRNYEGRYREHLSSMSDVLIKHSQQIEKIVALKTIKNQRNERIFALEKLKYGAQK